MRRKPLVFLLALLLLFGVPFPAFGEGENGVTLQTAGSAQDDDLLLEIMAADGSKKKIDFVDAPGSGDYLAVLTSRWGEKTNNTSKYNVAVQVDGTFTVTQMANKAPAPGIPPAWQDSPNLDIPPDGFVLLAVDDSYATKGYKKFAAEHFNVGDRVQLLIDGQPVTLEEFKQRTEHLAQPSTLILDQGTMLTVEAERSEIELTGMLTNFQNDGEYSLAVGGQPVTIRPDGTFSVTVGLQPKTNYIEIDLYRGTFLQTKTYVAVYRYMKEQSGREVYLWIEQSTNLNKYPTSQAIRNMLVKAKQAGVTAVAFPVKGHEGFASYLHNELSGIPHISQIKDPAKAGVPSDLDVLQEFIRHCRELGLRIDAVFNVYGAGAGVDTGLTPEQFDQFEEWVYRPEDGGRIVPIRQSAYKPDVYFMNPANEAAQQYQLRVIEEVMRHYDIDAVVLDRARYDNIYADFSDISRSQFEQYLASKGKTLRNWPADVMEHRYDENGNYTETVRGPLFLDWLTYRSSVSKSFFEKVRAKIDEINAETGKQIRFAISMGAWYSSYYEVGQNWASADFRYDPRLGLPLPELYTEEYAQTAFGTTDIFDYMILGTYYNTVEAIMRGITLIHILTQEQFPVYAGFQLQQLPDPEDQRKAFQMALNYTNGIKLFDLSVVNWDVIKAALENRPYVKTFQVGISVPNNASIPANLLPYVARGFIEADYVNQNRAIGTIAVYTDTFGLTTGTPGSYGVEAIVGADGRVADVVNKQQAISWNWTGRQPNNSAIPRGGFVISTLDPDGIRTYRQLIAHAYSVGDEVRASVLRGHLDYEDATTYLDRYEIKGNVEVLGPGSAIVTLNGIAVPVDEFGDFKGTVPLPNIGKNTVHLEVWVDGHKTNDAVIEITRLEPILVGLNFSLPDGDKLYEGLTSPTVLQAVYSDDSLRTVTGAVYASSAPDVVSVGPDGVLTALRKGTAVITAEYGGITAQLPVTVVKLTGIATDRGDFSLDVGQSYRLSVTALYEDGASKPATGASFSSSHERVATVTRDGVITAVKPGTAVIRVEFAGMSTSIKVKVYNDTPHGDGKGHNK